MVARNSRVTPDAEVRSPARSFLQVMDSYAAPGRDTRSERALQAGLGAFSSIVGEQAARSEAGAA